MRRAVLFRVISVLLLAATVSTLTVYWTSMSTTTYITASPAISQRFASIPDEYALVDLCYRLRSVYGVTGVSYRDFDAANHTAVVTVFYDPKLTSVRQIGIFVKYVRVLWAKPGRT